MVGCTVRELEADRLVLPMSEDTQITGDTQESKETGIMIGLVQQMRNYTVERVSSTGLPIFSSEDDHTLTAYMLAITGFILEFSDMRGTKVREFILPLNTNVDNDAKPQQQLADIVRQLDTGVSATSAAGSSIASIFAVQKSANNIKRSIARGDKKVIRRHFSKRNINRHSSFGGSGRKSF